MNAAEKLDKVMIDSAVTRSKVEGIEKTLRDHIVAEDGKFKQLFERQGRVERGLAVLKVIWPASVAVFGVFGVLAGKFWGK